MAQKPYTIGVDFGTLSGRAVLIETETGVLAALREKAYPHGVMTGLPGRPGPGQGWALQDPADYLTVLEETVPALLEDAGVSPAQVAGLAFDATSCTVLPALADGTPLCRTEAWRDHPHAYVKLWKHHAAQPQAERIEALARAEFPGLLDRYGGRVSSQWLPPKALELKEEVPAIYRDGDLILEALDWLTFQLTGRLCRSTCAAGFKCFWDPEEGYAPLLARLDGDLPHKLRGRMTSPWEPAGTLTPRWAERLGLTTQTVVAAGIIDAHAGVLGSGITESGKLLMMMGTSACYMLLSPQEQHVPGICGSCRDGILPGLYAYEAGQACVGDVLDWFIRNSVPAAWAEEAREKRISVHQLLSEQAERLCPGESGLLALDWWNGQRTPLVDDRLSGLMLGMTLRTTPAEQYRALAESTAYGARTILELFERAGMEVSEIVACGGIAQKNPFMMQLYADVLGRPIRVADSLQTSALGAAILAAVAARAYPSLPEAVRRMTGGGTKVYRPNQANETAYQALYEEYATLSAYFGQGENDVMKRLLLRGKQVRRRRETEQEKKL